MFLVTTFGNAVAQSCPTLRDPMDFSLPGSSAHGIFQARVLEWGAIAFSDRGAWQATIHGVTKMENHSSIQSKQAKTQRMDLCGLIFPCL